MDPSNQTVPADRHQARADHVVAMARRHADEIRTAAEQEAERILRDAERENIRRRQEQLEAQQHERERIAVQHGQIEDCIGVAAAALSRIRELLAVPPGSDASAAIGVPESSVSVSLSLEPTEEKADRRQRILDRIAIASFGVVSIAAAVLVATLVLLSEGPVVDAANGPTSAALPAKAAAGSAPTESSPSLRPVSTGPSGTDVAPVAESLESGLTVAFVAAADCWITIASDDGASSSRLLKPSETHVVRARGAVAFKAGNAGALSLQINGRPARPLGAQGQVVTRRITRENYRSFLRS